MFNTFFHVRQNIYQGACAPHSYGPVQ